MNLSRAEVNVKRELSSWVLEGKVDRVYNTVENRLNGIALRAMSARFLTRFVGTNEELNNKVSEMFEILIAKESDGKSCILKEHLEINQDCFRRLEVFSKEHSELVDLLKLTENLPLQQHIIWILENRFPEMKKNIEMTYFRSSQKPFNQYDFPSW